MAGRLEIRAAVVVFGDLGRSPRMVRHALSLAQTADVDLIGLEGAELPAEVEAHPRIHCHRIRESRRPDLLSRLLCIIRFAIQVRHLVTGADLILIQNPPALPAALAMMFSGRSRRPALVIDWHNTSVAMLALRLGKRHPAVWLLRIAERLHASSADAHLCVSAAMRTELDNRWGISGAAVFYDRPTRVERALEPAERVRVRRLLAGGETDSSGCLLVVSPTSWGRDEDFQLLLDAAALLDRRLSDTDSEVVVTLTGNGAGRKAFDDAAAALHLSRVRLRTSWIPADGYPGQLFAADAGLCLHRSASGVDLPMKLADLLGAGVPVFALRYARCLDERFVCGEHGWTFETAQDLASRLVEAARPGGRDNLLRQAEAIRHRPADLWDDAWNRDVLPFIENVLEARKIERARK